MRYDEILAFESKARPLKASAPLGRASEVHQEVQEATGDLMGLRVLGFRAEELGGVGQQPGVLEELKGLRHRGCSCTLSA